MDLRKARIAIIGAGPTGLGAAWRLQELGYDNWTLFERESHAGGLASSFRDDAGFTWDIGGHVQFSHYHYFDALMDQLLGERWLNHRREAWIWMLDRFLPYPFQNNIRRLPHAEMKECLSGLIRTRTHAPAACSNFEQWTRARFGEGIARHFMQPYNAKVWAHPLEEMDYRWVGDRVAEVDLESVVLSVIDKVDDVQWGPNRTFRFPEHDGTGAIWTELARRLPAEKFEFGKRLARLDAQKRRVHFEDGCSENYDVLISTAPLDMLAGATELADLKSIAAKLAHSSTHVVGIGLTGTPPLEVRRKSWMYFPEPHIPFYRATVFSNYSPNNVPDPQRFWSLMVEVSESPTCPVMRESLVDAVLKGLRSARLIEDAHAVATVWHHRAEYGYPIPTLGRDRAVESLLTSLERFGIYSRGRFGAWKYEVSNQDHSLMQGVELIDRFAFGSDEVTLHRPEFVNARTLKNDDSRSARFRGDTGGHHIAARV